MTQLDSSPDSLLLFIYGTLKRGHCRAPLLAGQRFQGTAQTTPDYRLVNCGRYPGLVRTDGPNGSRVVGELWEVDRVCLAKVDVEEGVDEGLYERAVVEIEESSWQVEGYLYLKDVTSLADCGNCWTLEFERTLLGG